MAQDTKGWAYLLGVHRRSDEATDDDASAWRWVAAETSETGQGEARRQPAGWRPASSVSSGSPPRLAGVDGVDRDLGVASRRLDAGGGDAVGHELCLPGEAASGGGGGGLRADAGGRAPRETENGVRRRTSAGGYGAGQVHWIEGIGENGEA